MIKITRGLDLPIAGEPDQVIDDGPKVRSVAVVGYDYVGMKPTMEVSVGDKVKKGQLIFTDKKTEGVKFTAPAAGTVSAINRGAKRVFQSLVIDLEGDDEVTFPTFIEEKLGSIERQAVVDSLVNSGLWTALRTRPFSKVPAPASLPHAIFVNAMDTNPLAANPDVVINESVKMFHAGLQVLGRLTEGRLFLVKSADSSIDKGNSSAVVESFSGPHPAGLSGTHIHFLDPVGASKTAWTINYQDVIAMGKLFLTGKLDSSRVIALAGPGINKPRLIRTQLGADLTQLVAGELKSGEQRVISGSVLSGRTARGATAYLGRYHLQVSVLPEGREREFMGWFSPGTKKHSVMGIYLSQFKKSMKFAFTTNTNGSPRAIVPIGAYEKVMPLDILPTQLLRAIVVGDMDMAVKLGALELDEEDLALCSYVCSGKYEYGPILRDNLTQIEKEG
jgi:Na+-transporting NADH:ubiquinone oxidoreductase subunit A